MSLYVEIPMGGDMRPVVEAEKRDLFRALGFISCQTCGGSGLIEQTPWKSNGCDTCGVNGEQGLGVRPSDEMVERVRKQILHYLDDELFLDIERELEGIVDWNWLSEAALIAGIGLEVSGLED